jgi:hypothetical protein
MTSRGILPLWRAAWRPAAARICLSTVALFGTPAARPPRRSPGREPDGICCVTLRLATAAPVRHRARRHHHH